MSVSTNVRASLFMILSMMGFTVNDLIVKSIGSALSIGQVMAIRGAMLLVIIAFIVAYMGLHRRLAELLNVKLAFRSAMEVCATLCFLTALYRLPFATISAILQALPLTVALGAALFFHEPVGWRRWIAIGIGFIGVMIIIRPGLGGFEQSSLLVLVSVLFAAARDLVTRSLPESMPSLLVSGATTVSIAITGLALATAQGEWQSISSMQLIKLAAAACFLFFGYQFIVMAMRIGEVAYVVPFRYTSLIWAIALGYIVFGELPDQLTVIGAGIVIATGLFTLYREIVQGRRTVTATTLNASGNIWHERKR